jgi:hypothetical protein
MMLDPHAALLFPDFVRGDLLQVQGRTEIVWEVPENERLAGAERPWRLKVTPSLASLRGTAAAEPVTERCADRKLVASDTAVACDDPWPVPAF